jgi:hypothetical protein
LYTCIIYAEGKFWKSQIDGGSPGPSLLTARSALGYVRLMLCSPWFTFFFGLFVLSY